MTPAIWTLFIVSCVFAAIFFIWLTVWMVRHEKEKKITQAALQKEYEWATEEASRRYGWHIEPTMDSQLKAKFPYAAQKKASAVFTGQWRGREFGVFEYTAQIQSLSSSPSAAFGDGGYDTYADPHWIVAVAVSAQFPEMELRKNTRTISDTATFLKRFENPPPPLGEQAFDEQFMVIAKDRSVVPAVFAPKLRQFILADTRLSQWRLGFLGPNIYSEADARFTVDQIDLIAPKLDMLCDFLEQMPQTVWGDVSLDSRSD